MEHMERTVPNKCSRKFILKYHIQKSNEGDNPHVLNIANAGLTSMKTSKGIALELELICVNLF